MFQSTPLSFSFVHILLSHRDEGVEGGKSGEDPTENTNQIELGDEDDHLKMLAWLAGMAIARKRIENRIFRAELWKLLCDLHVKGSGRGVAMSERTEYFEPDHLLAIAQHPCVLSLSMYQTTNQKINQLTSQYVIGSYPYL